MGIDVRLLIACGVQPTQARVFAEPLVGAFKAFNVDTPSRMAAFIAQAMHESLRFTRLEESLWYTTPERIRDVWPSRFTSLSDAARYLRQPEKLANYVYANRLGNGDEASGDGWKYRGRGIFHLTGRANYMAAGDGLRVDYKSHPELVADPADAAFTAGWYWTSLRLNDYADNADIDGITRRVNGPAMLGADERRSLYDRAMQVLS